MISQAEMTHSVPRIARRDKSAKSAALIRQAKQIVAKRQVVAARHSPNSPLRAGKNGHVPAAYICSPGN